MARPGTTYRAARRNAARLDRRMEFWPTERKAKRAAGRPTVGDWMNGYYPAPRRTRKAVGA